MDLFVVFATLGSSTQRETPMTPKTLAYLTLKTMRVAQQQIDSAKDRIVLARLKGDRNARLEAQQDLADWEGIMAEIGAQADYAIAEAEKANA